MSERGNEHDLWPERYQKPEGQDRALHLTNVKLPDKPVRIWCRKCEEITNHKSPFGCVLCYTARMESRKEASNGIREL